MNLQQRIESAIDDFAAEHPEWDTSITGYEIAPSKRGRGPGLSVYVSTADGMGFEIPLQDGDQVAPLVGQPVH